MQELARSFRMLYDEEAFSRQDEGEDAAFYREPRMVAHLDRRALMSVEQIISALITEKHATILDLMASCDSHLSSELQPSWVVGLGLNRTELESNASLREWLIHDLNQQPSLPFEEGDFDVVLNTASVDYLTRPFEVFAEAGRVLRPGGLFLVLFSNRMFAEKAVKIWRQTPEDKRVHLVEDYFNISKLFEEPQVFVLKGRPRPPDDKYAHSGLPSDPIYAVYAVRRGAERPLPRLEQILNAPSAEEIEAVRKRRAEVDKTLRCPHCQMRLNKWAVPQTPFTEWDNDHLYLCFNDQCDFFVRGWTVMAQQGNHSFSYRFSFDPDRRVCSSMVVQNSRQLRESIVD